MMLESVLVLGSLVAIGVFAAIATAITPHVMTVLGLWGLALGLAAGLPTGLWYHIALYRTLARKMTLPSKWWLAPTDLHVHLGKDEVGRLRPWFLVGGLGFVVSLIGGLAAMAGMLLGG
jgi:hypothetical protein